MSEPTRTLPERPDLDWYRKLAKKRLRDRSASEPAISLTDAQLALARELGFKSWRALKAEVDQFNGERQRDIARMFLRFAEQECAGSSPLYESLSRHVAQDASLLAIASLGRTPIPNLFFAAVHYVLASSPHDPLAQFYPSLVERARPHDEASTPFRSFCLEHRSQIVSLMRRRYVQTNEVARAAYLLPAFRVAAERAGRSRLALVEIGTSAGLNLCADRFAIDYGDGRRRGDPRSRVDIRVELRGPIRPPLDAPIEIARRIGIDLNPVRSENTDDIAWLNALIWPEHAERRDRLAKALAIAQSTDIEFITGDANEHLDAVLRSIADDQLPIVFQTHSTNQFTQTARDRLDHTIRRAGQRRPIAFVSRLGQLTLDIHAAGRHEHLLLADTDGHGRWFEWKLSSDTTRSSASIDASLVKAFSEAFNRDRGDLVAIRELLDAHPELVHCQPWAPQWSHSAIEAAAHQCVWHRPKMHEIAKLLVERGAVADLPTLARAGLLDEVKKRLDADPSLVNKPDKQGRTAIFRAACTYGFFKESIPVVEELIRRGAQVDVFTASSWLMIERLGPMLKQVPAMANLRDPDGLTALHWVTRTDPEDARQTRAAGLLLDAGADPSAAELKGDGMRPLHTAAEWASSIELAQLLIDRGAGVNDLTTNTGWTPLDYAVDRNRAPMRDFLRTRGGKTRQELSIVDDDSVEAFLAAVYRGDLDGVRTRLDATPSIINRTGKHPAWGGRPQALHIAIESGHQPVFDLLLERGANAAGDNALYDHWSPLMLAIHWKRDAMRDALLTRVDHVSLIDALMMKDDAQALRILASGQIMLQRSMPNDATMLHFARTRPAAERLLELGVEIDATDKYGKTPLDLAAEHGAKEVVDLLLSRGANASAATFARLGDLLRLKKTLAKAKPDGKVFRAGVASNDAAVVKWLISRKADIHETNDQGVTALHEAAFAGHFEIVKLLVKHGADVHAEDDTYNASPAGWAQHAAQNMNRAVCAEIAAYLEDQMSKKPINAPAKRTASGDATHWKPIMDASFVGDAKRVAQLIKDGADPNIASKTTGGHRPLHRAIENKKTVPRTEKHLETVRVLLTHGADPMLRGSWDKHTALALASMDDPRFVPILLEHVKALDIFHACCVLDEKRVTALLKKDATLASARDENRFSPLHYVAATAMFGLSEKHLQTQLSIARRLIDAGGDVKSTYNYANGQWPISVLYFACGRHNNPRLTELLIEAGADPCDNESVYHAADEGHDECLEILARLTPKKKLAKEATMSLATQMHWGKSRGAPWLLDHGADPNAYHQQSGNSALHSAALHGANPKVIDLLLARGADPSLKNRDGKTAIQLAKSAGKSRVIEHLTRAAKGGQK